MKGNEAFFLNERDPAHGESRADKCVSSIPELPVKQAGRAARYSVGAAESILREKGGTAIIIDRPCEQQGRKFLECEKNAGYQSDSFQPRFCCGGA